MVGARAIYMKERERGCGWGRDCVGWWWLENERLPSRGQLAPLAPPQKKQVHTNLSPATPCRRLTPEALVLSRGCDSVFPFYNPPSLTFHLRASDMALHTNVNIKPTDAQVAAFTSGPAVNAEALRLESLGDFVGAGRKHLEAIRMKEVGVGTGQITTAISYNSRVSSTSRWNSSTRRRNISTRLCTCASARVPLRTSP